MKTAADKFAAHQFSLRKLLLWITVFGAYLGVLRLTEMRLSLAVVLTVWLAVILFARLRWGFIGGYVADLIAAYVIVLLLHEVLHGSVARTASWLIVGILLVIAPVLVHLAVLFVNRLASTGPKQ